LVVYQNVRCFIELPDRARQGKTNLAAVESASFVQALFAHFSGQFQLRFFAFQSSLTGHSLNVMLVMLVTVLLALLPFTGQFHFDRLSRTLLYQKARFCPLYCIAVNLTLKVLRNPQALRKTFILLSSEN